MIQLVSITTLIAPIFIFLLSYSQRFLTRNAIAVILTIQSFGAIGLTIANCSSFIPHSIYSGPENVFLLDRLSCFMLILISTISLITITYSYRFLNGDNNRNKFVRNLAFLSFLVGVLVSTNNLLVLAACWCLTTPLLLKLTRHFHSAAAFSAGRKLFKHHIFADVFLLLAVLATIKITGSTDINYICSHFSPKEKIFQLTNFLPALSCLFVLAALIKSSVFPFHSWLFATLEAPTPFSAFLHAGLVNIAGFISFRLSPLIVSPEQGALLMITFGFVSALIGAVCSIAQPDVKRKLVFSTIGQMGFMCLQCGLGAFPAAVFHLFCHGYFKCYMFLEAGGAISAAKSNDFSKRSRIGLVSGWVVTFLILYVILFSINSAPALIASGIICAIAVLCDEYISSSDGSKISIKDLLFRALIPLLLFLYCYAFASIAFHSALKISPENHFVQQVLLGFSCLMLAIWVFVRLKKSSVVKDWLYVFAVNGAYLTKG